MKTITPENFFVWRMLSTRADGPATMQLYWCLVPDPTNGEISTKGASVVQALLRNPTTLTPQATIGVPFWLRTTGRVRTRMITHVVYFAETGGNLSTLYVV